MAEGGLWREECDVIIRVGGARKAWSVEDEGPVIPKVVRAEGRELREEEMPRRGKESHRA